MTSPQRKALPSLNPVSKFSTFDLMSNRVEMVEGERKLDQYNVNQIEITLASVHACTGEDRTVSSNNQLQPEENSHKEGTKFKGRVKKRSSLTLSQKMEILQRLRNGESQVSVARNLKMNRSTIQNVWTKREKFEKAAQTGNVSRKKCRMPMSLELEKSLLTWIEQSSLNGVSPTGSQIKDRAKAIADELGLTDFCASCGWFANFKHRNNIKLLKSQASHKKLKVKAPDLGLKSGECINLNEEGDSCDVICSALEESCAQRSLSSNIDGLSSNLPKWSKDTKQPSRSASLKLTSQWFSEEWSPLTEGYDPKDIFSVHEFGLFYKTLPENYRSVQGLSCLNGEYSNERLSILCGTNIEGCEKHQLLVVGCSSAPNEFGPKWSCHDQKRLPTEYWYQCNAWISQEIFSSWLQRWNNRLQMTGRKVLLLMDESLFHQRGVQSAEYTCIKLVLIPTYCITGFVQARSSITYELKKNYRSLLLHKQISKKEVNESREVAILDALGMLHTAWTALGKKTITDLFKKSILFRKLRVLSVPSFDSDQLISEMKGTIRSLIQSVRMSGILFPKELSFQTWIDVDRNLISVGEAVLIEEGTDVSTNSKKSPYNDPPKTISNSLDHLRNWAIVEGKANDLGELHNAISIVQNFCLRNIPLNNKNMAHAHIPALTKLNLDDENGSMELPAISNNLTCL